MRSKWTANGGPQIKAKARNGEKRRRKRRDDDAGAGGNENEYTRLTRDGGKGHVL